MMKLIQSNMGPTVVAIAVTLGTSWLGAEEKEPPKVTFEDDAKSILRQKCFACHNADKKSGDLDLTNYTSLMLGGGSGPVVEPGDAESSYLYMLITHESEPFMPPESPKMDDAMIEIIRKWIDGGALENAGSKSTAPKKPKLDLALDAAPTERPETVAMPEGLSLEPRLHTETTTTVTALATSPWAPLLAVGGQEQVLLYHTETGDLLGILPFPEGIPEVLKFSRNGALLLAGGGQGGASGLAVVWNVTSGERIFEIGDELDTVLAADISSDQSMVALGGPQRVVRVYSTETGQLLHEHRKHTDWVYSLEFSPDSVLLATGDRNGGLLVWEAWTGREYLTLQGHQTAVTGTSWRGDSNILASCDEEGKVMLWEMENGRKIKDFRAHGGGSSSVEYSSDGRLVTCGRDRVAKLWDQNGKQLRAFPAFSDIATEVTVCDETNCVVAGDWSGAIRAWSAADGKPSHEFTANPPTLAQRLAQATQVLKDHQAKHQAVSAELRSATELVQKSSADLAMQRDSLAKTQQQIAALEQRVGTLRATAAELESASGASEKSIARHEANAPLLSEAADKWRQAAEQLKDDAELRDLATKLESVVENRRAALQSLRATAADQRAKLASNRDEVTAATSETARLTETAKKTQAQITAAEAKVAAAKEKATAAQQKVEPAAAELEEAQRQADHWKQQIDLARQITANESP
jgi:WD40 repeat protein